jgi:hypothetical protein
MKMKRSYLFSEQHTAAGNGKLYEVQKVCELMGRFRLIISVYTSPLPPAGKKQNRGQCYFPAGDLDSPAHRYV